MSAQTIPVNMYETPHALVVVAVAPAVTAEDVTVERTGTLLRITARLRNAAPRQYLLHEWTYGDFERDVELPEGYGGDVEASLANGQLVIRVLAGEGSGATTTIAPSGHHAATA